MCRKNVDFLRFTFMYTHLLVLSSPVYPSLACARHHLLELPMSDKRRRVILSLTVLNA